MNDELSEIKAALLKLSQARLYGASVEDDRALAKVLHQAAELGWIEPETAWKEMLE